MNEQRIHDSIISHDADIRQAMEQLETSGFKICLVCDEDRRTLGVITDGDVRRGLLRGLSLSSPAEQIMKKVFLHVVNDREYRHKAHALAQRENVEHIPVLDDQGRVHDIIFNSRRIRHEPKENVVVIMAGGLGSRLRPITDNCPKPLLRLGDRPLLETIILNFKRYGFTTFYISINYLGHMIVDHFKSGESLGVNIHYLQEENYLGTAGSLSLLPSQLHRPFIVINGDVIINLDIDELLMQHIDNCVLGTMCIRQYNTKIPYGVVETDGKRITNVHEKPNHSYFINTGLYCLEPTALEFIQLGAYMDMPDLFKIMAQKGLKAGVHLTDGPWLDIGNISDYQYASENAASLLAFLEGAE